MVNSAGTWYDTLALARFGAGTATSRDPHTRSHPNFHGLVRPRP
jgi:hypothetical protein